MKHKLAFKITASIGLLLVILLALVYWLFSDVVLSQFEQFLEIRQEVDLVNQPTDPGMLKSVTDALQTQMNRFDTAEQIQAAIAELNIPTDSLLLVIDPQAKVVATNQIEFTEANLTFYDDELLVKTSGKQQMELQYQQVMLHDLNQSNLQFLILPHAPPVQFQVQLPEEAFKMAVVERLLLILLLFMLLGLVIVWWIVNNHTKRLRALTAATIDLKWGQFPAEIAVHGHDELADLTNHFNHAFAGFKQQELLRKQMISDVAHELRTPLTHMRGQIEAVLDGLITADNVTFNRINQEIIYLTRLVHDLQDLSLAQAKELKTYPELCTVHAEVDDIILSYQFHDVQKRFKIINDIAVNTEICTDKTRFKQIVINLLDNAIKHAQKSVNVILGQITAAHKIGIFIEDDGPGIPNHQIDQMFQRHTSIQQPQIQASGMGLGLAIVQQLATALEINIEVSSEPGKTRIILWFKN